MKRAIAILLSLAIVIALCPAMISSASEGGSKIDLSGYLDGMTNISKFAQPVATASASYENWGIGIAALLDGKLDTRFIGVNEADVNASAAFSPMWIQLDLQDVYTIGAVEFNSWQNGTKAGLPTAFTIQVSTDGTEWTTVHTETDLPLTTVANSSLYSFSFDAVDARYVKLDVTAIGGACDVGNYVCLSELSVFTGTKAEEVVPSTSPEIDLTGYVAGMTNASGFAQNVISTNHSEEAWGLGVASLIDGKTVGDPRYIGTGSSTFDPTWILIDLQKVYTVDKFAFYSWHYNNNPGMPKDFTIETSLDGETWTVVHTQTDLAITEVPNSNLYEFSFKAVDARYVKLNVTAIGANADTGPHLCLCEVKVFGVEKTAEGGDEEVIVPVGEKINLSGVTASESLEMWGFGVANLIDGSLDTTFASESTGAGVAEFKETWITVDLGKAYMVDQFKYFSYAAGEQGRPNNIVIEVSVDGESWTEAYKNENVPLTTVADSVEYAFAFKAVEAQYVRLTVKGVAANWDLGPCVCLREIEVYGAEKAAEGGDEGGNEGGDEEVIVPVGEKINLSGVNASASLEIWGFGAANLIDGNLDTMYTSESTGAGVAEFKETWITVDLGKAYMVDQFKYFSYAAGEQGRPNNIVIEVSADGESWTEAYKNENVPLTTVADSVEYAFAFKAVEAQYVRLTVKGVAANWDLGPCVCLREIEVYGAEKAAEGGDEGGNEGGDEEVIVPVGEKINLSGVTASESLEMWGFGAANLIDGNLDTMYTSESTGAGTAEFAEVAITFDLGDAYMVDQFKYFSYAVTDAGRPSNIVIEASTDGETWTEAYKNENVPFTTITDNVEYAFAFKAVEARYIRLTVKAVAANWDLGPCVCLREIEVYGAEKAAEGGDETPDSTMQKIDLTGTVAGACSEDSATQSDYSQLTWYSTLNPDWKDLSVLVDGDYTNEIHWGIEPNERADIYLDLTRKYDSAVAVDQIKLYHSAYRAVPSVVVILVLEDGTQVEKTFTLDWEQDVAAEPFVYTYDQTYMVKGVYIWQNQNQENTRAAYGEIELYQRVGDTPEEPIVPVGDKIDLSGYVAGMTSPSGYAQTVVTTSASLEIWGFGQASLIDGNIFNINANQYYCSEPTGSGTTSFTEAWIQLDLQKVYTVDQFKFYSFMAADRGRPNNIVIETSLDGETWTVAYKNENVPLTTVADSVEYAFAFKAVDARYVKLTVKGVADNWDLGPCVCLREVEVYGKTTEEVVRGEKLEINPAKVTVSGEYTPNMGKNNLFDGKLDSIFAAIDPAKAPGTRMDEWFQIDLQQSYTVNQIRMANRSDAVPLGGLPSIFDVMVSDDGETWKVVKSVDGISESDIVDKHWLIVDFDPVEARYVRVRAYDIGAIAEASLGYAVTLREFEVHTAEGKIDLSSYVNLEDWSGHPGENSQWKSYASNYPQNVVTASQSYELWGWGIAGLIDGVVGTESIFCCRVNSDAAGPVQSLKNEITVDLGAAYFLDTMRFASMAANSLAGLPIDFKLEVSLTGAQWRTVLNKTKLSTADAEADGQFYTFAFAPTEAIRFVRLTVTKVSEVASEELGYCAALSELELYGTLDPTTVVKPDGYGKIDLSKAVLRASNSYNLWGHGTGNLYNGSQNQNMFIGTSVDDADYYAMFKDTEVFENTSKEFIKIRLDGIYEIDLMRFQSQWAGSGRGVPNSYTLEVSMDGETWTTALFVDGKSVSSDDWYSDDIVPVQARYLRLKFHNFIEVGDLGYAAHLKELEFYGVLIEKDQIDLDVPAPEPPALDPPVINPEDPTDPETPTEPSEPDDDPSGKTGDNTTMAVIAAMTLATTMLAVLVLNRRKFAR